MTVTAAPPVINLEALLAPISDAAPSGESLQYSGVYDEIKEARRADDNLDQGSWQRELKVADYRKVIGLAASALETQTKDLQIAVWFGEALVKQHGFVGMRDGLSLMHGLHRDFWDTLFPEIDEGDLEARANALEWFDRQTAYALKEISLTDTEAGAINYYKWEESLNFDIPENIAALDYNEQERYNALKKQATDENRTTAEMWRKAKNATTRAFYENLLQAVEDCQNGFIQLDAVMDERFGNQTPGLGALKKSLDDVLTIVKRLTLEKRALEPDEVVPTESVDDGEAATNGDGAFAAATNGAGGFALPGTAGAIRSRQDALKRLGEVADYFRKTEPHSPVSYLVQRAVRWGNMPLEGWLGEIIKDDSVMSIIRETLGVTEQVAEE